MHDFPRLKFDVSMAPVHALPGLPAFIPTNRCTDASMHLLDTKTSLIQSPLFASTSSHASVPASCQNKAPLGSIFPPASLNSSRHHLSAPLCWNSDRGPIQTASGGALRSRRRSFQRSAQGQHASQTSESSGGPHHSHVHESGSDCGPGSQPSPTPDSIHFQPAQPPPAESYLTSSTNLTEDGQPSFSSVAQSPSEKEEEGGGEEGEGGSLMGRQFFGVPISSDTVAIGTVYFVQGVLGLSRLAVSFFLKDELKLDPAETALLSGVSAAPWLVKPLYGFISDALPLFGYRRRSYLVLCGVLGTVSWTALSLYVDNKYSALAAIFLSSLSVAVADVVVDSMVVERARGESQSLSGSLQSLCWGSAAVGGIVSAYFSGSLVESYGTRFVFGLTALLPLITSAAGVLVREERVVENATRGRLARAVGAETPKQGLLQLATAQFIYLWETVRQPSILLPTVFIFVWQATPVSDTAMFFFTTNRLGFGPEFLGRVRLVTSVASLLGVAIFNTYLKEVPLRKLFLWTTLMGAALGSTQLLLVTGINRSWGISDQFFAVGDSLFLTVLGQVSFMPILVLAARLCPPGVEATLFATLMSISNGAGVTGGLLGGALTQKLGVSDTNFDNLALLLVICNASSLLPLPFLGLLPSEGEMNAAVEQAQTQIDAGKDD